MKIDKIEVRTHVEWEIKEFQKNVCFNLQIKSGGQSVLKK